jgi:hypothetical protein
LAGRADGMDTRYARYKNGLLNEQDETSHRDQVESVHRAIEKFVKGTVGYQYRIILSGTRSRSYCGITLSVPGLVSVSVPRAHSDMKLCNKTLKRGSSLALICQELLSCVVPDSAVWRDSEVSRWR